MQGEYRDTGKREGVVQVLLRRAFCGRVDKALEERVALEARPLCLFLRGM